MPTASSGSLPIRNRRGAREWLAQLQGSPVQLDLSAYDAPLAAIHAHAPAAAAMRDDALTARARDLRAQVTRGDTARDAIRAELFALAREAAHRTLGLRPYDEQLLAALAMDEGAVVEMQTGEGKTLAAVLPAALNALAGRGVHVLTFNDYLARRDAEWMRPVYRMLGVSAACALDGMTPAARRDAYAADVTYVTAKEAGFDLLRDHLALRPEDVVHRPFHLAIVDEADSLLIDEARVPLVIAGAADHDAAAPEALAQLVSTLTPGIDYDMDEYARDVELTDAGIERVERALECGPLHADRNYRLLTEVNCALHARALLRRDVDYLVRGGRVEIIDEFTGRVVHDRHWPDGLQAAVEAKEGVRRQSDGQILGTIALQHFIRLYPRLCGMTGTAQAAADELRSLYGLRTVVIPTHARMIRTDHPDRIFTHRDAKEQALTREITRLHRTGRPVLAGTLTVEESDRLAARLRAEGVVCQVLNARQDAQEAGIVANAGAPGAVTIATNMAGRGTDIRLGGADEAGRDRVVALGGLCVIGTNRHESRRVDLQLRGRAGRQGDPGETQFFVGLDDDLLVRYGIRDLIARRFMPAPQDEPIDHPVITREIARAQRIIEGQNFEIRRTLWRYSSVVEHQRRQVMERRQAVLAGSQRPDAWHARPARRQRLVDAWGEDAVARLERRVELFVIDRAWRDHLAFIADLREGIHLVSLGGHDPLARFTSEVTANYQRMQQAIEDAMLDALERTTTTGGEPRVDGIEMKGPSSTWTYVVNDDPFKNQIGRLLTGPGGATIAVFSAALLGPLLVAWGLVDRMFRKRPRRRNASG